MPPCMDFPRHREDVNILHGGGEAFFAIMGDRPKGPAMQQKKGVIVLVLAPLSFSRLVLVSRVRPGNYGPEDTKKTVAKKTG